jgi:CBS domain containing-hemolysin-like protein
MIALLVGSIVALIAVLVPVSFVQLLYLEALRLRTRDLPALELFKEKVAPRLHLDTDEGALGFSLLKHALLLAMAVSIYACLAGSQGMPPPGAAAAGAGAAHEGILGLGLLLEATLLSWLVMVVVAHLAPQILYRRTSGTWILWMVPLLRVAAHVIRPVAGVFRFLEALADLSAPAEPQEKASMEPDNVQLLIAAGAEEGIIEEGDRTLIQNVVDFGDKRVRQVMTPRPQIVAIAETATLEQLHQLVVREQYSRIPTYHGDIDNITGFVHVRDLFEIDGKERPRRTVAEIRRPILAVPESMPVEELLREMQRRGDHMVVVVDEYGQTAGLATMEDLVEEIVGEIRDEHEPAHDMEPLPDGSYVVSGNLDLDNLSELLSFRPGKDTESTTVGGLATEWMGHVPQAGEAIERGGLRLEVLESDERRVSRVKVSRAASKSTNGEQTGQ